MKNLLFVLCAGLIIASCQPQTEKQLFTESEDIDYGKKIMQAYLTQTWDAYPKYFADTAKIWRNKNWSNDEGFTVQQYVEDLKGGLKPISSYSFESQIWLSIITDTDKHWVYFWGVWTAHNDATNKDYEMPVHVAMQIVDGKVVQQGEFYDGTNITLDMMALAQEKEAEENAENEGQ
jgi:hypothetical protein